MRRAQIEYENDRMVDRQRQFRRAADVVTDAFAAFEEVEAVAVIGSVAKPLWKEISIHRDLRRTGLRFWHECRDLDLAVWLTSRERLGALRRAMVATLRDSFPPGYGPGIANHQVEVFLFEPGTDRHFGRLCRFNACPKKKIECLVPGCGAIPFNRIVDGFVPWKDILAPAAYATLYRRSEGRLMSALDLPGPKAEDAAWD